MVHFAGSVFVFFEMIMLKQTTEWHCIYCLGSCRKWKRDKTASPSLSYNFIVFSILISRRDETNDGPFRAFHINFWFALAHFIPTVSPVDSLHTCHRRIHSNRPKSHKKQQQRKTRKKREPNFSKWDYSRSLALKICSAVSAFDVREMILVLSVRVLHCICTREWIRHGVLHYVSIN